MSQAETKFSTIRTIDTIRLSDRLKDIAGRLDVVHLAMEGVTAEV